MYHNNRLSIMKLNQLKSSIIRKSEARRRSKKLSLLSSWSKLSYFICSRMVPQEPIKVDQAHSRVAA